MTKDELLLEISNLREEARTINEEARRLEKQLAEMECPYKVGQIMVHISARGWGNKKKEVIERAIIKAIYPYHSYPYYAISGFKLRKDGSESRIDAGLSWKRYKPEVKS